MILLMLAAEDETARTLFAVYVRPEGRRGEINFYPDEAAAVADVGPGMPPGILTHGDTYVEYIGEALLFAPENWPLIGVDQDSLVQLQATDREIFVALTPSESRALQGQLGVASAAGPSLEEAAAADLVAQEATEGAAVDAPTGVTGERPCLVWFADGHTALFADGPDAGGRELPITLARGQFGDEVTSDRMVVAALRAGWVPLVDDSHSWREFGEAWVLNVQPRISDEDEQFLGRYTAHDRTLVVTRSGTDTGLAEEHLQFVADKLDRDFAMLTSRLRQGGWLVDPDSRLAADLSTQPDQGEEPGWFPVESDDGVEWVAAVVLGR
jgi:hypothetical protein